MTGHASTVTLTAAARDKMIAHARAAAPAECCGVLLQSGDRIVDVVPGRNIAEDPLRRYELDPQDHFHAIRAARQAGLQVIGFYHSHPHTPAEPSPTDRAEANYAGHLYVIVSLAGDEPDVRAYRYAHEELRPVDVT